MFQNLAWRNPDLSDSLSSPNEPLSVCTAALPGHPGPVEAQGAGPVLRARPGRRLQRAPLLVGAARRSPPQEGERGLRLQRPRGQPGRRRRRRPQESRPGLCACALVDVYIAYFVSQPQRYLGMVWYGAPWLHLHPI